MNLIEARNHPLVKYAQENLWGSGVTDIPEQFEKEFFALPENDQRFVRTFFTAATTSCPVPLSLAEDPQYGPAYLEKRYTSVETWYRYLKKGPLRDSSFGEPVDLTHLGGRGRRYDQNWIPEGRENTLIGPSTYEGHILPRLIIDILDYSRKQQLDVSENTFHALNLIAFTPDEPIRAIASLAIYMNALGFSRGQLHDRLFDAGYRDETPEDYWRPILESLGTLLPKELRFHD